MITKRPQLRRAEDLHQHSQRPRQPPDRASTCSLSDRLGIIIRRQGGATGPARAGKQERLAYAGWLAENELTS